MRKTDKKIENALRRALTEACDMALEKHDGFMWLTHFANYQNFPDSLTIVCVFDTNEKLSKANDEGLRVIIKDKLASIDIKIKNIYQNIYQNISFDTEESCKKENNGKWDKRLN